VANGHGRAATVASPRSVRHRPAGATLASGERPPVSGREGFLREIARDAERGWAISNEEIDEGVWAATAAVHDEGHTVAALSAPCPAFRLTDENRAEILDQVRKTAHRICGALGP
jgi:IclR family transcriptional regulator, acetate operon repressor